jgi:hypothetical protein
MMQHLNYIYKKIADQNWWFFNSENFKEPEPAVLKNSKNPQH